MDINKQLIGGIKIGGIILLAYSLIQFIFSFYQSFLWLSQSDTPIGYSPIAKELTTYLIISVIAIGLIIRSRVFANFALIDECNNTRYSLTTSMTILSIKLIGYGFILLGIVTFIPLLSCLPNLAFIYKVVTFVPHVFGTIFLLTIVGICFMKYTEIVFKQPN